MYDEYLDDYLDELLEEAYLEGYYDSLDDYDEYLETTFNVRAKKNDKYKYKFDTDEKIDKYYKALSTSDKRWDKVAANRAEKYRKACDIENYDKWLSRAYAANEDPARIREDARLERERRQRKANLFAKNFAKREEDRLNSFFRL